MSWNSWHYPCTPHLCLSMGFSLWRLCPGQSHPHSPLMTLESKEVWSLVRFALLAAVPSSRLVVSLVGLEGGLTGSFPCCLKMVPVPSINSWVPSPPNAELCSFWASTSWELTQVLLLWWLLSELLEEQPCFFCVEMARNMANRHPTRGVPTKGRSSRRGARGGGVPVRWAGLLEEPR